MHYKCIANYILTTNLTHHYYKSFREYYSLPARVVVNAQNDDILPKTGLLSTHHHMRGIDCQADRTAPQP